MNQLISSGLVCNDQIKSCTDAEVEQVASRQGVELPRCYREFLLSMGRGAAGFLRGTHVFYSDVLHLKDSAEELLVEDGKPFQLPADALVFLVHQGYQFMYFLTASKEQDPAVFHYLEGEGKPVKKWDRFSDYLHRAVDDAVRLAARPSGNSSKPS